MAKFAQDFFSDIDFALEMEPYFERRIDPFTGGGNPLIWTGGYSKDGRGVNMVGYVGSWDLVMLVWKFREKQMFLFLFLQFVKIEF